MSNGALAQLTSYGAQDVYLSGNPQIPFLRMFIKDIQILQCKT